MRLALAIFIYFVTVYQRADWLNLGWSVIEKQEVMQYLNERYYKYPLTE